MKNKILISVLFVFLIVFLAIFFSPRNAKIIQVKTFNAPLTKTFEQFNNLMNFSKWNKLISVNENKKTCVLLSVCWF